MVLQVSGEGLCGESFGVEKQDVPALYAQNMQVNYVDRMAWFGKPHGSYEIVQGDFLEDRFIDKINEADIIFVNNFAFGLLCWCAQVSNAHHMSFSFATKKRRIGEPGFERALCQCKRGRQNRFVAQLFASFIHDYRAHLVWFASHLKGILISLVSSLSQQNSQSILSRPGNVSAC